MRHLLFASLLWAPSFGLIKGRLADVDPVAVAAFRLLLAAAATARRHGAVVLGIHEQASPQALRAMAGQLWRWPAKAMQAAQLRWQLRGVGYHAGSVVTAAAGEHALQTAIIAGPQGLREVGCDLLAVGYGLVPSTELASLLGCALQ